MEEFMAVVKENLGYWLVGLYALSESLKKLFNNADFFYKIFKKLFPKWEIKTKRMIEREQEKERLDNFEKAIAEIKETSKNNVAMFLEHEKQTIDKIGDFKNEIVDKMGGLECKQSEMNNNVGSIKAELEGVKKEFEEKNADDWRWDILDFFNSSINNRRHYKEEWEHVINQLKKYERYVEVHEIDNGVFEEAATWLRNEYHKHIMANDFLQPENNSIDR
jgi:chromosome segregation ATPase